MLQIDNCVMQCAGSTYENETTVMQCKQLLLENEYWMQSVICLHAAFKRYFSEYRKHTRMLDS